MFKQVIIIVIIIIITIYEQEFLRTQGPPFTLALENSFS